MLLPEPGQALVARLGRMSLHLTLRGLVAYPAYHVFALNFSVKKFDRYPVPAHLPLALLATLGWLALFLWLANRWPPNKKIELAAPPAGEPNRGAGSDAY